MKKKTILKIVILGLILGTTYAAQSAEPGLTAKEATSIDLTQYIRSARAEEKNLRRSFKELLPQAKKQNVDTNEVIEFYDAEIRWKSSVKAAKN